MSFKVHEGHILEKLGINRMAVLSGAGGTISGVASESAASLQSFWDEDYTGFQHAGMAVSHMVKGGAEITGALAFGHAIHSQLPGKSLRIPFTNKYLYNNPAKMWSGAYEYIGHFPGAQYANTESAIFLKGKAGGFKPMNQRATMLINQRANYAAQGRGPGSTLETLLEKNAQKGFWTQESGALLAGGGKFMKRPWVLTGAGAAITIAATIVLPWAFERTVGLAGQLLDESNMAYNQAKGHSYDNRQFNSRSLMGWGMQMQESAMSTLVPFEANMMSLARLYHR